MRIREMYTPGNLGLSFEIFPPKTEKGLLNLFSTTSQLAKLNPCFVSGTYGAGGTTRDKTLEMLNVVRTRFEVPVTAHFTTVGSTVDEMRDWLRHATYLGIQNIMALRGDPPVGQDEFVSTPGGLRYASELVSLIKTEFPHFGIGVAGYPETHREAEGPEIDLVRLKHKVDCGADAVFTQLFYDNADFYRFRDKCSAMGINVPIVPGLLPVVSLAQVQKITGLCAAKLPSRLHERLRFHDGDPESQLQVGIDHCGRQCEDLVREGVPGIHFYVLNRSDMIRSILGYIQ